MAVRQGRTVDVFTHAGETIRIGTRFRFDNCVWKVGRITLKGGDIEVVGIRELQRRRQRYFTIDEVVEARKKGLGRLLTALDRRREANG